MSKPTKKRYLKLVDPYNHDIIMFRLNEKGKEEKRVVPNGVPNAIDQAPFDTHPETSESGQNHPDQAPSNFGESPVNFFDDSMDSDPFGSFQNDAIDNS